MLCIVFNSGMSVDCFNKELKTIMMMMSYQPAALISPGNDDVVQCSAIFM